VSGSNCVFEFCEPSRDLMIMCFFLSSNSADPNNNSSVVSPEQSIDGAIRRPAENNRVGQPQQVIARHPGGMQQQRQRQQAAPAPVVSQPPVVAVQGIALPPAPIAYAQPRTHIAPAPTAPTSNGGLIAGASLPQGAVATKRRRIDAGITSMGEQSGVMTDPMMVSEAMQVRGRKKTQAQIDRRRERNRILARRTRLRKKFFFESLQKEVVDLQRENGALKDIVRSQLKEGGNKILEECDAFEKLPEAVIEACGEHASDMGQEDFNLVRSIQQSQHSFVITDPSLQDNPIVFASDDFLTLTGYEREDVLGRNCRFLQGTETSQDKVQEIRKSLATGSDVSVTLVNYTADGTPFWNKLFIASLRDAQDNIVNFIGVVVKVTSPEPGDPEHGKELPDEITSNDALDETGSLDSSSAAMVADVTVKTIEEVVDAAVAGVPPAIHG
jgi:PAS domain S-box-containing protein